MNQWAELANRFDSRQALATLLALTFAVRVLGSNLFALLRPLAAPRVPGWVSGSLAAGLDIARLFYYLGPPFLALYFGWADLHSAGLGWLLTKGNWTEGIWQIAALGATALGLLMLVWWPYLRATRELGAPVRPKAAERAWRLLELFYQQAHCALYRAGLILLFGDFFWGSVAGLGLTLAEGWSDPRTRREIIYVGRVEGAVWSAAMAGLNTAGFLLSRNLVLVALLHALLEFSVPHLQPPSSLLAPLASLPTSSEPTNEVGSRAGSVASQA